MGKPTLTKLQMDTRVPTTGNSNMSGNIIKNIGPPVITAGAATKAYAAIDPALTGGTMSGAINMSGNIIKNIGNVSAKTYLDMKGPIYKFTGTTVSGNLNMSGYSRPDV
jgi:hypothetical protein